MRNTYREIQDRKMLDMFCHQAASSMLGTKYSPFLRRKTYNLIMTWKSKIQLTIYGASTLDSPCTKSLRFIQKSKLINPLPPRVSQNDI